MMKYIASKIILVTCMICMALSCGMIVHAAEQPSISVTTDTAKKNAQINLNGVGIMIYSAEITFNMDISAEYTLIPNNGHAYSIMKKNTENNTVTLYVDSTDLMDGSNEIELTFLTSDKEMNIPSSAELTIIDRAMRPESYNAVVNISEADVVTPKPTKKPSIGGGGGGGGSVSRSTPTPAPAATNPPAEEPTVAPTDPAGEETNAPAETKQSLFDDVAPDYWAADVIAYVTEKGLFQGTSENTFEPQASMTRAMYVTVLKRFGEKIDPAFNIECAEPAEFDDVAADAWYYEAASWAGGTGLVNGIGDNKFGPSEPITREQIAVMTINFAKLCGLDLSELSTVDAVKFTDSSDISDWAAEAVAVSQRIGLISGRDTGMFAPKESASRAEVAAVLQRFAEKIRKV